MEWGVHTNPCHCGVLGHTILVARSLVKKKGQIWCPEIDWAVEMAAKIMAESMLVDSLFCNTINLLHKRRIRELALCSLHNRFTNLMSSNYTSRTTLSYLLL
jgi:hypothetical protein